MSRWLRRGRRRLQCSSAGAIVGHRQPGVDYVKVIDEPVHRALPAIYNALTRKTKRSPHATMQLYYDIHDGTGSYTPWHCQHPALHNNLMSPCVNGSKTCGCRRSWPVASVKRALCRTGLSPSTQSWLRVVGANAGHAVNIEAAETFNTAVVDFLRRHL